MSISRIVSGGQTGVDRAALDAALALGVDCGGWCPHGRLAEDGPIHPRYPLSETPTEAYAQRTEWNVRDSDGTLILTRGALTGGTLRTRDLALELHKPVFTAELGGAVDAAAFLHWIRSERIAVLNVAGPRESGQPGIYREARSALERLLAAALAVE